MYLYRHLRIPRTGRGTQRGVANILGNMPTAKPVVRREAILAFRRRSSALDRRLPAGPSALRRAVWAGLQDSMPRAALLSIHARVRNTSAETVRAASLVQVWGPRYHAYVVARRDLAYFSIGRMPDGEARQARATRLAARLREVLGDGAMKYGEAAKMLGVPPNELRYAATTGTIVLGWDGARQPTIRAVDPPTVDPDEARRELARRYLHIFGPSTADAFAGWAGVPKRQAGSCFDALARALTRVRTPIGDAWALTADIASLQADRESATAARLLPSGDPYFLLQGAERELLIPDLRRRQQLWTSRVWPGAMVVDGELVGTWRRADHVLTMQPWCRLAPADRVALESEAASLPLPGLGKPIDVRWPADFAKK